jgi:hypothetical protein
MSARTDQLLRSLGSRLVLISFGMSIELNISGKITNNATILFLG